MPKYRVRMKTVHDVYVEADNEEAAGRKACTEAWGILQEEEPFWVLDNIVNVDAWDDVIEELDDDDEDWKIYHR